MQDINDDNILSGEIEIFFKKIYASYYSDLCHYAMRFLRNTEDSEEIVQGIIHKLWENRDSLHEIQSLKSYLYRAVHNRCLNQIKFNRRTDDFKDSALKELKKIEQDQTEEIYKTDLTEHINNAIELLPDRCREVFTLSRFKGLKNKEIASDLGISIKAVEANISRALVSLRKNLKEFLTIEMIIFTFALFFKHL